MGESSGAVTLQDRIPYTPILIREEKYFTFVASNKGEAMREYTSHSTPFGGKTVALAPEGADLSKIRLPEVSLPDPLFVRHDPEPKGSVKTPEEDVHRFDRPTSLRFGQDKAGGPIEVKVELPPDPNFERPLFRESKFKDSAWSRKLVAIIAMTAGNDSFHIPPDEGVDRVKGLLTLSMKPGERSDTPEMAAQVKLAVLPFKSLTPVSSQGWDVVFREVPTPEDKKLTEKIISELLAAQLGVEASKVKLIESPVIVDDRKLPKELSYRLDKRE